MVKKIKKSSGNRFLIFFKTIMLVLSLYYSLAMPVLTGAGLIYNRRSYGEGLAETGAILIISGLLMTSGAIFCLFRKNFTNIFSLILSVGGCILCMVMLHRLVTHADASGWTDKFTLSPISDMYKVRVIPCIAPVTASAVIAFIQLFSYDLSELRREKRRKKEEKRNAPSPKILGDE